MSSVATADSIEGAVASGLGSLINQGPIIALLILVIAALCWFVKWLLNEAKEERTLNRQALINSTTVLTEIKEMIRAAISK